MRYLRNRYYIGLTAAAAILGVISVSDARQRILPARTPIVKAGGKELAIYQSRLGSLILSAPKTGDGLTVVPLLGKSANLDYYLMDEAFDKKVLIVEDTGSVNSVRVVNKATRPILIIDGEEILGAKQNRIFNSSLLVPAKMTITAEVSCVEQNRWTNDTMYFRKSGVQLFAGARQANASAVGKSMSTTSAATSDQSRIWSDVDAKNRSLGVKSETKAMHGAYKDKSADLKHYESLFTPKPGQVGAIFAVNGQIVGLDVFDSANTLTKMYPKLLKSYGLDALEWKNKKLSTDFILKQAKEFWKASVAASGTAYPSQGQGADLRVRAKGLTGSALIYGGEALHIAIFKEQKYTMKPVSPIRPHTDNSDRLQIR